MRQNIGVGQFRRQYGGRNKRKGTVPEHYARASGGLIRHILKQLEARARPAASLRQRTERAWPGCVCAAGSTNAARGRNGAMRNLGVIQSAGGGGTRAPLATCPVSLSRS